MKMFLSKYKIYVIFNLLLIVPTHSLKQFKQIIKS